jgi:glycosyltransferase involved in cell wall biosynthesis
VASIAFHDPRLSSTSGGGETVTLQLISFLLNAGHDVTVITRKSPHSPVFGQTIKRESRLHYFEIEAVADQFATLAIKNDLAKKIWHCDRLAPEALCFNLATRVFYENHRFDLVVVSFIPDLALLASKDRILLNVFGLPPNREIALIERPLLERCCGMMFASNYTKQHFRILFDLEGNGGLDPVMYASVQTPFFECLSKGVKEFDACFVGRLVRRKGLYSILEAVSWLKIHERKIALAIVGNGQERQSLATRAMELGISEQITWFGAVGPGEVARIIDRARCFLSPVLQPEAFACGNIEAMARGVPVITTNLGGTTDYICPGENALICDPGRADSLAIAIEQVLDNSELSERLRSNGLKTAQQFHPDRAASRWLKVFEDTLRAVS